MRTKYIAFWESRRQRTSANAARCVPHGDEWWMFEVRAGGRGWLTGRHKTLSTLRVDAIALVVKRDKFIEKNAPTIRYNINVGTISHEEKIYIYINSSLVCRIRNNNVATITVLGGGGGGREQKCAEKRENL